MNGSSRISSGESDPLLPQQTTPNPIPSRIFFVVQGVLSLAAVVYLTKLAISDQSVSNIGGACIGFLSTAGAALGLYNTKQRRKPASVNLTERHAEPVKDDSKLQELTEVVNRIFKTLKSSDAVPLSEFDSLQSQLINQLQSIEGYLKSQASQLRMDEATISSLRGTISEKERAIQQHKDEAGELQGQIDSLRSALTGKEAALKQQSTPSSETISLREQVASLNSQLAQVEDSLVSKGTLVARLERELATEKEDATALQEEIDNLKLQLKDAESYRESQQTQIDRLQELLTKAKALKQQSEDSGSFIAEMGSVVDEIAPPSSLSTSGINGLSPIGYSKSRSRASLGRSSDDSQDQKE